MVVEAVERIDVGSVRDVDEKTVLRVALPGDRVIAVAQLADGTYIAFDGRCPHKGGPLSDGRICEDVVVCPWHGFRFDLRSGEHAGMHSIMKLPVFPVTVEADRLFVTVTK